MAEVARDLWRSFAQTTRADCQGLCTDDFCRFLRRESERLHDPTGQAVPVLTVLKIKLLPDIQMKLSLFV